MRRLSERRRLATLLGTGLLLLISFWSGCDTKKGPVDLVILHVNDTHGRLLPFDDEQNGKDYGGIARRTTLIRKIEEENEGRTLVLHSGDIFSRGDPLTAYFRGEVNMRAMEAAGYDIMVPGEGEFYFGLENLKRLAGLVRFPVLAANIYLKASGERVFAPYLLRKMAGVRVAVLGLGKVNDELYSGWSLEMRDPIEAAREFVPMLRDQADLLLGLTHQGSLLDEKLAEEVPQFDILVGGDDHVALEAPLRIPRPDAAGEVVCVQAGHYGAQLGRIDVRLESDEQGRFNISRIEGCLIPVDGEVAKDPRVEKLLARYMKPLSEVVCVSKVRISNSSFGPSPLRSLVAEAMRAVLGADVALLGAYMTSWSVQGEIEPGEVTLWDLMRIYNFGSFLLEYDMSGDQLAQVLGEVRVHASGCDYRVTDGRAVDCKVAGVPLDPGGIYRVVIDDPLLAPDSTLRRIPFRETSERVDTALIKYLKKLHVIERAPEAR
jgi:5'-nucleotidase/UDP-sugar diphosphatase